MFHRIKQLTLLLGDWLALYLAFYASLWLRSLAIPTEQWSLLFYPMTRVFVGAVIIFFIVGLYDLNQLKNRRSRLQKISIAMGLWVFIGIIYFYLFQGSMAQPKTIIVLTAIISILFVSVWRTMHDKFLSKSILKTNIVFAGITPETNELIEKIEQEPEIGYEIVGIIKNKNEAIQETLPGLDGHTAAETIAELVAKQKKPIQMVVISPSMSQNTEISKELYTQLFTQTSVVSLAKFYEDILKRIPPFTFSESWFLTNLDEQNKKIYDRFRIIIDFLFSALMAIAFAVTYPFIALAIKINSPGPIFFVQERIGRNGARFKIIKYRTMQSLTSDGSAETHGAQYALVNDARITTIGKFLRKTRLDELPQFINIFKNEMSLVGPRPERPEFVDKLTNEMPYYKLRHLVKPGLTGWAQIQKSYYGTIEENLRKLEYDLYYLKNRGLMLDISIILRTLNILGRMAGR